MHVGNNFDSLENREAYLIMFEQMDTGELVVMACGIAVGITLYVTAQFRSVRSRVWESEQRIIAAIDKENGDILTEVGKLKTGVSNIKVKLGINGGME